MENIDIDIAIDNDILENIDIYIDIDKYILENIDIDINIDKEILENIDIDIDIDKEILENIDIDKISNRLEFGISNRARWKSCFQELATLQTPVAPGLEQPMCSSFSSPPLLSSKSFRSPPCC